MIQEWWTFREIANARFPGLPTRERGLCALAEREGWDADPTHCRKRTGRGGGREYHYTLFPERAIDELTRRAANAAALAAAENPPAPTAGVPALPARAPSTALVAVPQPALPAVAAPRPLPAPTRAGADREAAKLAILAALDVFLRFHAGRLTQEQAMHKFVGLYNAGEIAVPADVRKAIAVTSRSSLWNWLRARENGDFRALSGRYRGRAGGGVWDNELSMVRDYVIGTLFHHPHWSVTQLLGVAVGEFGDPVVQIVGDRKVEIPLPSLRHFQRLVATWKDMNQSLWLLLQSPDDWKNRHMLALGDAGWGVVRPNQAWMIDASPQDVLTTNGRWTIYLVVDVYTRRILVLVTKTPRTEAVKLLVRRSLLEWGVPEMIRTDNGSDFVSREAIRVFAALGIEHETATPYSPWEKSFVERAIGTLQRWFAMFPGYCGHNVAAAQALRARKTFDQRLGEDDRDAFQVQLDAQMIQKLIDVWVVESYGRAAHGGLDGRSPAEMLAASTAPISRVADERALDLLLMRVTGTRLVRKEGLRVNNNHYWSEALHPFVGTDDALEVRVDPADPAVAYVWSQDPPAFVTIAKCLEMMTPEQHAEVACEGRASQRKRLSEQRGELRQLHGERDALIGVVKSLGGAVARNRSGAEIISFPAVETIHTSPALELAGEAQRRLAAPTPPPVSEEFEARHKAAVARAAQGPITRESDEDIWWRRAQEIKARLAAGEAVPDDDIDWISEQRREPWYGTKERAEAFKKAQAQEAALSA